VNLGFAGTVTAGLVVAIVLAASGRIPALAWGAAAWRWLVRPVPVPFLVLIFIVGALVVFVTGILLKSMEPAPPTWLDYRQDTFLGIVWRWRYDGTHLAEWSIRPYCPRCGTGLRWEEHGYMDITTSFNCDECRFTLDVPGGGAAVTDRICRLIEREVNKRLAQPSS
jgi:hypothetical protein